MPADQHDTGLLRHVTGRPEHELLLLCSRVRAGEGEAERIKTIAAGGLDWEYLLRLARRHAVLPLLHRRLEACAAGLVPETIRQKLRAKFRDNATRNILLASELLRITNLLEGEGIPVLAYKGPALAVAAYGDLSLRRFIDLDIIVRQSDARKAGRLLRSLGFGLSGGLSDSDEEFLLRSQHNLAFTRDGGKLTVELHWEVASRRFASVRMDEQFRGRAVEVKVGGGVVRSPAPEEMLVALCVHGTKHLWERLAWVCDVAELSKADPGLEWNLVVEQARAGGVERMLLLGLRLAHSLLGLKLPEGVGALMSADKSVSNLAAAVAARMFDGGEYRPAGFIKNVGFNLSARPRLREKIRYLRLLFQPTDGDLAAFRLPAGLTFFYYLLRPFRLLLKGSGH